ncbi:MAG: site-specific DNA-methyltransferase [Elusimicrobiota bacterium]|nr:MAG: site-specific DNA-methyltransferase [Elusimicrobiota bacterium]
MQKTKLELNWIGKENRPKLEPRILVEEKGKSYHASFRVDGSGGFENRLIFGDNLLALRALEQEFSGKIKCIYIDPPFNTGAAFEHYDDGVEHSLWLNLMYQRFEILYRLLSPDGVLWVHLDDNESAYTKVILDEIFGRGKAFYRNTITVKANSPFGFKHTSGSIFKSANHILVYAKSEQFDFNRVFVERDYDTAYRFVLKDRKSDWKKWEWESIGDVIARQEKFESAREAKKTLGEESFTRLVAEFAILNAERVFRTASVTGGARQKRLVTLEKSAKERDKVFRHPNDDMDYYFIGGERVLFYDERLVEIDGQKLPGETLTDIWTDISWEGIAREGGVDFPKGKKPEQLLRRIIEFSTRRGDWVLDSFGGSGTTGAVAHKMGRKWILVEFGEHCQTHIIPRLQGVIDGRDKGVVTEAVGWKGGGGFRYYRIAPSLLEKDKFGNWVISKEYDAVMLAEAICKLEGFAYAPSDEVYWRHGHSTEKDFIYVTTQTLSREQLQKLSDEVGEERSLLVMCGAFRVKDPDEFPNLTVKKIPKAVLSRCEWGQDDYSLEIKNLPLKVEADEKSVAPIPKPRSKIERREEALLFDLSGAEREPS